MQKAHVTDVVNVDLNLEYDDKSLAIQLDGQYRGREQKFTDRGLSLNYQALDGQICSDKEG